MKILLRHILTAALLGVIGCTSADSEKGRFDRIAKDLDMGGSSFFIGSSRHAGTAFEQLLKQHERYVWSSSFTPEAQYKLQRFISCSELAGRLAGLHEIKGWGGSSKELPGTKERVFRNRFRLLLNEKSDGVLWNLFSPQNRALWRRRYPECAMLSSENPVCGSHLPAPCSAGLRVPRPIPRGEGDDRHIR